MKRKFNTAVFSADPVFISEMGNESLASYALYVANTTAESDGAVHMRHSILSRCKGELLQRPSTPAFLLLLGLLIRS